MTGRTFREKVIEAQRELGLSHRALADRAGVSYDVVRELHRRPNSTTGAENAEKLRRALSIDEGFNEPPGVFDVDLVPVYDIEAGAGRGVVVYDESSVASLAFPPGYLSKTLDADPADLKIISVKGDSMIPTLAGGDVVMIDMSKRDLSFDGIFVFREDGEALQVKRIGRASRRGYVTVIADNSAYPTVEMPREDVDVLGRVIWAGCKM